MKNKSENISIAMISIEKLNLGLAFLEPFFSKYLMNFIHIICFWTNYSNIPIVI